MRDNLGSRMKANYEVRTRTYLPRRTYSILRVDGRAFHTLTRGMQRPYDPALMDMMDAVGVALCKEVMGARFAYVQSDEVSVLFTDFTSTQTEMWFDGEVQKITSIGASIATEAFNKEYICASWSNWENAYVIPWAQFDARVFTIPDRTEVENYFIWRNLDATRNAISMAAQAHFSHNQLQGKSCDEMQEMLFQSGINFNDYPQSFKSGRVIVKQYIQELITYTNKKTGEKNIVQTSRGHWVANPSPVFSKERDWFNDRIPIYR